MSFFEQLIQRQGKKKDTGAEAWPQDAVLADDVITETEAGPLEESDFDADVTDEATDVTTADEETDGDSAKNTDGDTAEEKG